MDLLTIIATLLDTLAGVVPTVLGGTPGSIVATVMDIAATLVRAGDAGASQLQELTAHVQAMIKAGTDPTEDDWNILKQRSDSAHALIQSASNAPGTNTTTSGPASSGNST